MSQRETLSLSALCTSKGQPIWENRRILPMRRLHKLSSQREMPQSKDNRVVRINEELTQFHSEVLNNLNSIHGALLQMNRSIQAEGAFGEIKWNRGCKRIHRRGIEGVILKLGLISCGFNLHKYYLKRLAAQVAA